MIDYTYSVDDFNATTGMVTIRYQRPNHPDHRSIMPFQMAQGKSLSESLDALAISGAPLGIWQAQSANLSESELSELMGKQNIAQQAAVFEDTRTDAQKAIDRLASERLVKEGAGVVWSSPTGETIALDTTQSSQARFAAATTAATNGLRADPSKWKCARITANGPELVFRDTTNAELLEWSALVLAHVQKCFDAEAAAVAKVLAGDLTADFEVEFAAL